MRSYLSKTAVVAFLLLPAHVMAAESTGATVIVADSRHLTGLTAWWVNIYNESHFYFALLTIVTIPLGGAILGGLADLLMRQIGIDLKSRALREN
ncbi:MAG TPA: DVU0150 family protein [Bryobacteraceae bacterium]|nr:DVU0150 family protein [Bryobacteraceae bacterium]